MATISLNANPQTTHRRSTPSWLRSPQRVWLRRALFQIHLWVGLVIALYAIVIGLSGSALVFHEQIEHTTQPASYHLTPTPNPIPLDLTVRRIAAARPGWTAYSLRDLDKPNQGTTLLMLPVAARPGSDFRLVSFNRYTGEVVHDTMRYSGFFGWMSNLHYNLLAGHTGLLVSGWMALGLLILCLTGVILWWPGVARWASSLVFHRRARWKRLNWDLHVVIGFWSSAALIAVTFTGLYFAFPAPVSKIVALATGGSPHEPAPAPTAPISHGTTTLTIDQAIAAARIALPPNAPPSYLMLAVKPNAPYHVTAYYEGTAPYSQLVQITLDPHTGAALSRTDTNHQPLGRRIIQYFFAVHFGSFAGEGSFGMFIRALWVLLGIIPALLTVSGVLMYWNRKLRPLLRSYR